MAKKKSQLWKVLEHIETQGSITSVEAYELYGITRLSAIILIIRKRSKKYMPSFKIVTQTVEGPDGGPLAKYVTVRLCEGEE